jgi:ribonucleoside-diphosphate reductase beta chain
MEKTKIFNPEGNDNLKELVGNNSTNIINLTNLRFKWGKSIYQAMVNSFWIPEKIDLTDDDISSLTEDEKRAFYGILSFLIFLDSVQTNNLPRINDYIDSAEVKIALSTQEFFEVIHSYSYSYIIESTIPVEDRDKIYNFWRDDPILFERNKFIAGIYQEFQDNPTEDNFKKVLLANFALEGIYFYSGFMFFYNLASRKKMIGTASIIKLINRDELIHCTLFERMINEFMDIEEEKELIYSIISEAVNQEIVWNRHICGESILGKSPEADEQYIKYIANRRIKKLSNNKLPPLYENVTNPYAYLEKTADLLGEGHVKANFFESTVTSYNMSSSLTGWGDI